jgi:hypothetical protein
MHGVVSHSLRKLVRWRLIFVGYYYETWHPSFAQNSEVARSFWEISALLD